jgi:hypothetical protein
MSSWVWCVWNCIDGMHDKLVDHKQLWCVWCSLRRCNTALFDDRNRNVYVYVGMLCNGTHALRFVVHQHHHRSKQLWRMWNRMSEYPRNHRNLCSRSLWRHLRVGLSLVRHRMCVQQCSDIVRYVVYGLSSACQWHRDVQRYGV